MKMPAKKFYQKSLLVFLSFGICHFALYKLFNLSFTFSYDHVEFTYPPFAVIKQRLENGEFPFWYPEVFLGVPLFFNGNLDIKSFFLLKFFAPKDVMVLQTSLTMIAGGVGFTALARQGLGMSLGASLVGGVFWIFNGFHVWYFYDTPYSPFILWMPLQVFSILTYQKHKTFSLLIFTLALADQLQTGRLDLIEIAAIGISIFCLLHWWDGWASRKGQMKVDLLKVAPLVTIGSS